RRWASSTMRCPTCWLASLRAFWASGPAARTSRRNSRRSGISMARSRRVWVQAIRSRGGVAVDEGGGERGRVVRRRDGGHRHRLEQVVLPADRGRLGLVPAVAGEREGVRPGDELDRVGGLRAVAEGVV